MAEAEWQHPGLVFKFKVEITKKGGKVEAGFTECSGLNIDREAIEYREGGLNDYIHVLPGRIKYQHIVLKRGMTKSKELWDWFKGSLQAGKVEYRNMTIKLYSWDSADENAPIRTWNITDADPVKWTGATFNADQNAVAIETLELAHHGITET